MRDRSVAPAQVARLQVVAGLTHRELGQREQPRGQSPSILLREPDLVPEQFGAGVPPQQRRLMRAEDQLCARRIGLGRLEHADQRIDQIRMEPGVEFVHAQHPALGQGRDDGADETDPRAGTARLVREVEWEHPVRGPVLHSDPMRGVLLNAHLVSQCLPESLRDPPVVLAGALVPVLDLQSGDAQVGEAQQIQHRPPALAASALQAELHRVVESPGEIVVGGHPQAGPEPAEDLAELVVPLRGGHGQVEAVGAEQFGDQLAPTGEPPSEGDRVIRSSLVQTALPPLRVVVQPLLGDPLVVGREAELMMDSADDEVDREGAGPVRRTAAEGERTPWDPTAGVPSAERAEDRRPHPADGVDDVRLSGGVGPVHGDNGNGCLGSPRDLRLRSARMPVGRHEGQLLLIEERRVVRDLEPQQHASLPASDNVVRGSLSSYLDDSDPLTTLHRSSPIRVDHPNGLTRAALGPGRADGSPRSGKL
ncbi:hypothetical protein SCALM49S_10016 [Streptomyces californicus]